LENDELNVLENDELNVLENDELNVLGIVGSNALEKNDDSLGYDGDEETLNVLGNNESCFPLFYDNIQREAYLLSGKI
jgi:hypothetical protein